MANVLDDVIPQLLAQGLMALREQAVMPRLVNRGYEELAGRRGSTIDVPIPSAMETQDVVPSATPGTPQYIAPTTVPIVLDQWKYNDFSLTDKNMLEIMEGVVPMQASEAVKTLGNTVDTFLLNFGRMFYGVAGTAGVTPFASGTTLDAARLRVALNNQLAPMDPRYVVFNADAEGSALQVRAFQDASFGGGVSALLEGTINYKLGFRWFMDQNVPSWTAGTGTNFLVNLLAGYDVGDKTIAIDTGTGTLLVGDVIYFAGHTQTYVITEGTSGAGSISFEPGLVAEIADGEALFCPGDTGGIGDHVMNIGFHRDAIAFATRPLAGSSHPGAVIDTLTDDVTGLTLRLEMSRQTAQDNWRFDMLYGANVVRRELGARLLG